MTMTRWAPQRRSDLIRNDKTKDSIHQKVSSTTSSSWSGDEGGEKEEEGNGDNNFAAPDSSTQNGDHFDSPGGSNGSSVTEKLIMKKADSEVKDVVKYAIPLPSPPTVHSGGEKGLQFILFNDGVAQFRILCKC